jgi:tetratricopeptide (TPR) repeat protein
MRHRCYLYLIAIALLWCCPAEALAQQPVFDFNDRCRTAYQEIIRLRFDEGRRLLLEEKRQFPGNRIPYFLDNYIDFFTLFFNEDPQVYQKFGAAWEKRLDQMNEGPSTSPFFLFTKAILHFQRAAVEVKFGNNWNAGWEFRRSFLQIKETQERFPDFAPAQLYRGALQVAAGTIPDGYRWLSSLLGIKGTISQGMQQMRNFLASSDPYAVLFREEGQFFYCYLKFYIENDKEGVFRFLHQQQLDLRNNHLFAYLAANLSLNNQQSEMAKKYLTERNTSAGYFQTPVWDLEMGFAKLNHLEADAAVYFERFLAEFKGNFYVKEALQKLSWQYYLAGDRTKAEAFRRQILTRGRTDAEADKQALKEAQSGTWPDPLLLRARLLSDGGYYRDALRLLHGKKLTDFALEKDRLEFAYRVARIYDAVERKEEAIAFYRDAIRLGEKRKEYFAARAAIHLGNIYEARGEKQTAIQWYRTCLAMKDHDFKNSLDQRAKAGIARCKGQ